MEKNHDLFGKNKKVDFFNLNKIVFISVSFLI